MKTIICLFMLFQAPYVAGYRPFGAQGPLEAWEFAQPLEPFSDALRSAARRHNLPINLLQAIAITESGGDASAINKRTHDYGLMQINHRNFKHLKLNVKLALQSAENIDAAAKLLVQLRQKFGHETNCYARYNVGWARRVVHGKAAKRYILKLAAAGYGPAYRGTR